ncbi:MAG TPA: hypothetical protein VM326_06135, partial [Sphingomicrobium sp.]|nr:hypothetical protein [Sphingomicrobium sp.]
GNGETERAIALRAQLAELDKAYTDQLARSTAAAEQFVTVSRDLSDSLGNTVPQLDKGGRAAGDYEKQLRALERALDAAGEPQRIYAERLETISRLWREGVIDGEHARGLHEAATRAFEEESRAMGEANVRAGELRLGYRSLSSQISGMVAAIMRGDDPIRAITSRLNNTGAAVTRLQGAKGGFASFLMGPWGVAIGAGTALLAGLIVKLGKTEDEVKKLTDRMKEQAKQAELNRRADEAWKQTIEGVTEAIRKRREEQERSLRTDIQTERASLAEAQRELADQRSNQREKADELSRARASLERMEASPRLAGQAGAAQESRIEAQRAKVRQLSDEYRALISSVSDAERSVRGAEIAISERRVANQLDESKAATDRYTEALGRLRRERAAGLISQAEYERQLAAEAKRRDAELERIRERGRRDNEFGRRVSADEAAAIARAAGLQVNSGDRSFTQQKALYDAWVAAGRPKDNPVAPPGSSAHEGARGRWALDIQAGPGVDPASIRKTFADQGVRLTKVLRERGHWHVEGMRDQADVRA